MTFTFSHALRLRRTCPSLWAAGFTSCEHPHYVDSVTPIHGPDFILWSLKQRHCAWCGAGLQPGGEWRGGVAPCSGIQWQFIPFYMEPVRKTDENKSGPEADSVV